MTTGSVRGACRRSEDLMPNTDIKVFVGVDMAKREQFAHAVIAEGDELFARSVTFDKKSRDTSTL
jgi:hypothetical protein